MMFISLASNSFQLQKEGCCSFVESRLQAEIIEVHPPLTQIYKINEVVVGARQTEHKLGKVFKPREVWS